MLRSTRADWVLRWDHAVELGLSGLMICVALAFVLEGSSLATCLGWLVLAWLIALLAVGLWFAREWARWAFGLMAATAAVPFGVQAILIPITGSEGNALTYGVVALFGGVVAQHMLRPSTGRRFGFAREAIARTRGSSA